MTSTETLILRPKTFTCCSHCRARGVRIVAMANQAWPLNQVFDYKLAEQLDLGVTKWLRCPWVRTADYARGVRPKNCVGRNIE